MSLGTLAVRLHVGPAPAALAELASGPHGSFFHTPAWLAAVPHAEPRLAPCVLLAEDARGQIQAACPLFRARRLGLRTYYSGAWGTYGGLVARGPEAARTLCARLEALAVSPGVLLVRVHDFAGSLRDAGARPAVWSEHAESCQVLDLPADPQVLFRDAFTSQNRNKIRKAEKLGVLARRAHDLAALEAYAVLYRDSAVRWSGARALPETFFASLAGAPGVDVWLAERDGEPVAALLNFTCGGQVMNWGNVSRRDAWSLSPNNLLHWRALEAGCLDPAGPRLYNFGGSAGLPGVETFKSAFGAREHAYARREHAPALAGWLQGRVSRAHA